MKRTFAEAMAHRRSYYSIGSDSSVLDEEIVHIIREAVKNVPSAFNSQSTRIVLLLGDEHKKLIIYQIPCYNLICNKLYYCALF